MKAEYLQILPPEAPANDALVWWLAGLALVLMALGIGWLWHKRYALALLRLKSQLKAEQGNPRTAAHEAARLLQLSGQTVNPKLNELRFQRPSPSHSDVLQTCIQAARHG